MQDPADSPRPRRLHARIAAARRDGQVRLLRAHGRGAPRERNALRHRRHPPREPRRECRPVAPRPPRPIPLHDPPEHGRLLRREVRDPHRRALARASRDEAREARGPRRSEDAPARSRRHARGDEGARPSGLRRPRLHVGRPAPRRPARGARREERDARGLAHRIGAGRPEPERDPDPPRARPGPRDRRRGRRHRVGRRVRDGARRARCPPEHRHRLRPRARPHGRGDAGRLPRGTPGVPGGRIPRRLYANASSPVEGVVGSVPRA